MVLMVAGGVIAILLLAAYGMDRRGRKRGHQPADPSTVSRLAREARSDARGVDSRPYVNDVSWTDYQRRNK